MQHLLADLLLVLLVLISWIGVIGFLRLRDVLDMLHAAAFLNVAGGIVLLAAVFVTDRFSTRSFKVALITVLLIAGGAVVSQMIGRAHLHRAQEETRS